MGRPAVTIHLLTLFASAYHLDAQLNIHQYADQAACQLGGRDVSYLPFGITPGGNRIPMSWQGNEIVWAPSTPPNMPLNGIGEFKVKDSTGALQIIGGDFPEPAVGGPFNNPVQSSPPGGLNATGMNIKCDHFSYVDPSCTPDQYIQEVLQGSCQDGPNKGAVCAANTQCPTSTCGGIVRWHILFRRTAAASKDIDNNPATLQPPDWTKGIYTSYYDIVDAIGLKLDTYGTAWLDGTQVAAKDFSNGFRKGPMPRPGGKRPETRAEGIRALQWYDTPAIMGSPGGTCNNCHSTPFNGSDWIKQSGLKFGNDDAMGWWFAGNDSGVFPNYDFFTVAHHTDGTDYDCGSCHARWMVLSTGTPGGENRFLGGGAPAGGLARYMTMVHDAHLAIAGLNDSKGNPDINNPFKDLPSFNGDGSYRSLSSSYRTDKPTNAFTDKNAKQTHWMPLARPNRVGDWVATNGKEYTYVACCGANIAGAAMAPPNTGDVTGIDCMNITCTEKVNQKQLVANLVTPWMQANGVAPVDLAGAKPNANQFISPPDPPIGVSLTVVDCPAALPPANPGDRCFRLAWSDPNGSPFNAPDTFHYVQLAAKKVSDPDWTANEKAAAQYCGDKIPSQLTVDPASNVFPKIKETVIPVASGDKWRYAYETFGSLPKCQKMAIRLCGGWCKEAIKVAGEAEPAGANRMSTELGQLLTAANDTQADVSGQVSITRLGFRKNLTTGRFVQTVIIKNNGSSPMPSPLSLVLNSLTGGTLYNASGTTAAGPYVSVPVGGDSFQLTAGQSISLDLEFTDPANQAITYTTQVLALSVSDACK